MWWPCQDFDVADVILCECIIWYVSLLAIHLVEWLGNFDFYIGVIHKPRGQDFGYFWPPPFSWSLLLNKAYVMKWSYDWPPSPLTVYVVYEWPHILSPFHEIYFRLFRMLGTNLRKLIVHSTYLMTSLVSNSRALLFIIVKSVNFMG